MRKQLFVTLLLTCGMPFSAQMQALANPEPQTQGQGQVTIKGTVLDENDEPVRTEPRLLLSPLSLTLLRRALSLSGNSEESPFRLTSTGPATA